MSIVEHFEAALNSNLALAYLLAFAGGLLDCLTPCSAFATPVALGYFSTLNPSIPRRRVGMLTAAFALAVSLAYSVMGLLAAWIGGKVFAFLGTSPWPYWIVGALLIYLVLISANLLPMWLTPSFLRRTEIQTFGGQRGTYRGAILVGLGVAMMMGPCAAPILTAILYIVAAKQDIAFGVTLLLAFSLGISSFMVTVSLSGRKAVLVLSGIGKIRGHVAKIMDVLILIVAALIIYKGVDNYLRYSAGGDIAQNQATVSGTENAAAATHHYAFSGLDAGQKVQRGGLLKGVRFPAMTLTAEDGNQQTLENFHKDRWLFVTFWATWCKECVEEIPAIRTLHADPALKDKLDILAINVMETWDTIAPFAKERQMNYGIILDADGVLVEHLGVFSYPYNVLVNPSGEIVHASGKMLDDYKTVILSGAPVP